MALPSSGAISLNAVNVELGFSATATIAMNDAAVRTLFGIASGAINMSDGYGKANTLGFIEDVFSCFLYTGTGAAQTITNGIDLSTKGGLVWIKSRSPNADNHRLFDTVRGVNYAISSSTAGESSLLPDSLAAFNSNGFNLGTNSSVNPSTWSMVSWTFRKATKFFDVVTYTGNGGTQAKNHNLGSVPGFIIVKCTSSSGTSWITWHRSLSTGTGHYLYLNLPNYGFTNGAETWGNNVVVVDPTSTQFTVGYNSNINSSSATYVAYLFAHNAGGYGATGTDNIITCGTYTGNGAAGGQQITLGYEPQWVLWKPTNETASWNLYDTMRGWIVGGNDQYLLANAANSESDLENGSPNATGMLMLADNSNVSGRNYIYIAIRRGPMKVPTLGTSVFSPQIYTGTNTTRTLTTSGFPIDLVITDPRSGAFGIGYFDRLRGATKYLNSAGTGAEGTGADSLTSFASMNGYTAGADNDTALINYTPNYVNWLFRRAPSFFDIVCYTGNGAGNHAITHNLGVAPELLIIKNRSSSASGDWYTFHTFTSSNFKKQVLSNDSVQTHYVYGNFLDAQPTNTTFTVNSGSGCNASGTTYVAYLFSTAGGVSKVGSYTGTGALQTINCGFTTGARFVLIKRADSTGNWWTYDSARGISSGNDPYLYLNSAAAEVTGTNYVDTDSTGFKVTAAAPAELNANGGTYIFLAIS